MAKEQTKIQTPMIGGSSLLVIFAVLCLTVFALLGFSTVQAGRRLSDASIEAAEAFYRADGEAEKILADLRAGKVPDGVQSSGNLYRYACAVSDTHNLVVEVVVNGPADWKVLRWQEVSTTQWSEEEYLTVWDGEG